MVGRLLLVFPGLVFQCLFTYTFAGTRTITIPDDTEFDAECADVFRIEGITSPTDQEKRLVRRIVYLEGVVKRERDRATNAEKDKEAARKEVFLLKIPVMVRTIRDRLQEKWEKPSECENCLRYGHATNQCTQNERTKKSKDHKEEKFRRAERYWEYLVTTHEDHVEIKRLLSALQNSWKKHEDLFEKYTFEEYLKEFYRNFAIACDMTDNKVHVDEMIDKIKKLNVFGYPIDDFMLPLIQALGYLTDPDMPAIIYDSSSSLKTSKPQRVNSTLAKKLRTSRAFRKEINSLKLLP